MNEIDWLLRAGLSCRDRLSGSPQQKNTLWYLPSAERCATVLKHVGLAYSRPGYDTGSHFFIPQLRCAAENDRRSDTTNTQKFCFYFRRVHLFPGYVDDV
jgi:hypothetical protein